MLHRVRWLFALAFLALAPALCAHGAPEATKIAVKQNPNQAARDQTISLIDAYQAWANAGPGQRGQALSLLLAIARARHDSLAAIIDDDPGEVLRVALPPTMRAGMPPETAGLIEQDDEEDGDLEVLHFDFTDPAANRYDYVLKTPSGRIALNFAADPPTELPTGTHVHAKGLRLDASLALESAAALTVTKASALPNTLGAQKTLVILVNFSDLPASQPFSQATAQSVVFTTTSNFDYEASYQQTWLTGTATGWLTIASSSTTCDYNTIASQAQKAASSAGYVLSNYSRYVYAMSGNACGWWGLGTVGGSPSQAWVNSKYGFTLAVVGHEMGHNFGLYHSHSLDCGTSAYATSGCAASEYGDGFDIMGQSPGNGPHFNAFQKERLGWLNAGVSPPITVASATGTFNITPYENARDTTPRAIKIPQNSSCASPQQWLYVEARKGIGTDTFVASNANVSGGVLVHQGTDGNANSSYLLDMTPATASWSDPGLVPLVTYTDPVRGVLVTPQWVNASGAGVTVTIPGATCTHAAPTVSLAPTATQYTSAGKTVTYSVTVQNNDGCGCAASTFDVTGNVPAGWSSSNARTASVNPGATSSASVLMTASSSASAGFYPVAAVADNSSAPTVTGTASGTVAIVSTVAAVTVTDRASYALPKKRNQTAYVTISTTVTSSGSAVAGAAVSVQVTTPNGAVGTLSGTSGSNGVATVSYPLTQRASPVGTYAVKSTATVGGMTGSGSTSFVVQ